MRGVRRHGYCSGIDPFLKAALPTRIPKRNGRSLHRRVPGSSPYDTGAGTHTSYELIRSRRTAAREACNRPVVTSALPSSQKPVVKRVDCHATGIQLHHNCVPFRPRPHPVDQRKGSGPACHVTDAPVTTYKKLHRHSRQCCASSTTEPVPRLEVALCRTQQCQLKVTAMGRLAAG